MNGVQDSWQPRLRASVKLEQLDITNGLITARWKIYQELKYISNLDAVMKWNEIDT